MSGQRQIKDRRGGWEERKGEGIFTLSISTILACSVSGDNNVVWRSSPGHDLTNNLKLFIQLFFAVCVCLLVPWR